MRSSETPHKLNRSFLIAAHNGDISAMRDTLVKGADPNALDDHGNGALHLAKNADVVRFMLSADVQAAVRQAGKIGPLDFVTIATNHRNIRGQTPLQAHTDPDILAALRQPSTPGTPAPKGRRFINPRSEPRL